MRSWLLQRRVPTKSAPACDALRDVCTTCSVVRGWHASGALAVGGWWFTSTPSQSVVHGSTTGGLVDAVEVLFHMGILPLPEAFALVRGSGVSFSRWCSCGVLSLTVYSGVWGIG
jgi:hypothetical protein